MTCERIKMAIRSAFRPDLFAGKVAVVTGGGTGIGRAITTELALLGCKVVIASRKMERLESAAQEINEEVRAAVSRAAPPTKPAVNGNVYPFQCNIRKEEQVSESGLSTMNTQAATQLILT